MTLQTITKRQLLDLLDDVEDDARIVFSSDYGDRGHTEQAHEIKGEIEQVKVHESAYSASGFAIAENDDDEDDDDREDGDDYYVYRIK